MRPALFIDRDGTLNHNCPYCKDVEEIVMYDDIHVPLMELSKKYYIIIITNQSGISRGYFTLNDLDAMNDKVKADIEKLGGRVDAIYYCPHTAEGNCSCRKPKTGMVDKALKEFDIDLKRSFVIGDDDRDTELAKNAGVRSIRIRQDGAIKGDFFAEDFYGVLDIINKHSE